MTTSLGSITILRIINLGRKPVSQITDRAKRYRAQQNVKGPKKCVICGSTKNLDVMHLSGDESDGESKNLAYGCRKCNAALGAAFKKIGSKIRTRQYNPAMPIADLPDSHKDYPVGTVFILPSGQMWKVMKNGFKRITKVRGGLKAGEKSNPSGVPTFKQYAWAVAHHEREAHDEGGAVIHATPKHKRVEYARRIAEIKGSRRGDVPF